MVVGSYHVEKGAVRLPHLAVLPCFIAPGAVTAGTPIRLPDYARPASRLIDALILRTATGSSTHAACAASGAAYPSATDLLSPAGEAVIVQGKKLTIVTTAPAAGQIQLADDSNVVLGEDTAADDLLLLIIELK